MLDDYNRPPIIRAPETPDDLDLNDESWKGEHFVKIPKQNFNTGGGTYYIKNRRKVAKSVDLVQQRRDQIRTLIEIGFSGREIAERVGITHSLVRQDAHVMGLSLRMVNTR